MVYSKEHKMVLQAIQQEGALLEDNVKELIIRLFDHNNTSKILNEINAKLQPLCMTIKCINCEVTGQLYWVFVNTIQDKTASFHPEFSQAKLNLLRNVYSEIVGSHDGYVSSTFCLNLCSSLDLKLTKTDAEQFLYELVNRKWLCCKEGKYYMGVRSLGELLQYFKDTYEDTLSICILCKQELFYNKKCNNCNATSHIHCLENYVRIHGSSGCPNCHYSAISNNDPGNIDSCAMDIECSSQVTETQPIPSRQSKRKHKN